MPNTPEILDNIKSDLDSAIESAAQLAEQINEDEYEAVSVQYQEQLLKALQAVREML